MTGIDGLPGPFMSVMVGPTLSQDGPGGGPSVSLRPQHRSSGRTVR